MLEVHLQSVVELEAVNKISAALKGRIVYWIKIETHWPHSCRRCQYCAMWERFLSARGVELRCSSGRLQLPLFGWPAKVDIHPSE